MNRRAKPGAERQDVPAAAQPRHERAGEGTVRGSAEALRIMAEQHAALRRIATLAAGGAPPAEVFAAVTEEVVLLLPVEFARLGRYESDGSITFVAASGRIGAVLPTGVRLNLGGRNVSTLVAETGRAARIDSGAATSGPIGVALRESGIGPAVGTPITVGSRLWGVLVVGSILERSLPTDTEGRLAQFTELLAASIANAESRATLTRLAEEQAALRRVATVVAHGATPEEVFAAVTEQVGRLLPADLANMCRYESDGTLTFVATWGSAGRRFPVGTRWNLGRQNLGTLVLETRRPARVADYAGIPGLLGHALRETGVRSAVGVPITVDGRLWGMMSVGSSLDGNLPADTEERLAEFTELLATAIANGESRAALAASRARIVAAADETRRRITRDLHDGIQQQLVSIMLKLLRARAAAPPQLGELDGQLSGIADGLRSVLNDLQEISRGIHPTILRRGGLEPALRALRSRSAVPVELGVHTERRLPEPVEAAAYYVVAEALTNAAKHAQASVVRVELEARDTVMQLTIRDDGVGGADPSRGSGLIGLRDRVEALGGTLEVVSTTGSGTTLLVELPFGQQGDER